MLSNKSKGFQKLVFDRICQIHDEKLMNDPEYIELGKVLSELPPALRETSRRGSGNPEPI